MSNCINIPGIAKTIFDNASTTYPRTISVVFALKVILNFPEYCIPLSIEFKMNVVIDSEFDAIDRMVMMNGSIITKNAPIVTSIAESSSGSPFFRYLWIGYSKNANVAENTNGVSRSETTNTASKMSPIISNR